MKSLCVNMLAFFLLCASWMKLTCAVPTDELRATTVSESVIFITGGLGGGDSSEVLDPKDSNSSCSRLTASLPDRRYSHSMSSLDDGEVVMCGGEVTDTSCISTRSPDGPWKTHSRLTADRHGHASAVTGDTIHVLAGAYSSRSKAESLEDGRWRRRGNLPYNIGEGACAVAVNETAVFISGGYRAKTKSAMWNPVTDQWTPLADMDQPGRWLHGCTLITRGGNVFVLVAGGRERSNFLSTSRLYNVDGNYWSDAGELNQPRGAGVMVNIGEDVYYIGGYYLDGDLDSVEQFNIGTNKWVNTNLKLRRARSFFAAVAVNKATFC